MKAQRKTGIRIAIISGIAFLFLSLLALPFFTATKQEAKFEDLATTMRSLVTSLQNQQGAASWRYDQSCRDVQSGEFANGEIICSVTISLQQSTDSPASLNQIHQLYYPTIASNEALEPINSLDEQPDTFGESFVVSLEEQRFSYNGHPDISCRYSLSLGQQSENSVDTAIGSPITGGRGSTKLQFTCEGSATSYWYDKA